MKINTLSICIYCFTSLFIAFSSVTNAADSNEKEKLLSSSSFGIFIDYELIDQKDPSSVRLWREVVYTKGNKRELTISHDEIWLVEKKSQTNLARKKRRNEHPDIFKVFWKENQIQALVVEKYFPDEQEHKITDIYDRDILLSKL